MVWPPGRTLSRGVSVAFSTAGVVAVASAALWWPATRWAALSALTLLVLLAAAAVDVLEHRLPNALVVGAGGPVGAAVLVGAAVGSDAWTGAVVGAGVVGAPLLVTHLVSPAGLGFGDVKAGTVLGAGLGVVSPALAAGGLILGLTGTATWALARRHRTVPLGPGMVGGTIVALALGRPLGVEPW